MLTSIVKTSILLLILLAAIPLNGKADTLLIDCKHPDQERILLYEGKYFIMFKLWNSFTVSKGLALTATQGTYLIKDNTITFIDPAPWDSTITNKYYTWPARRIGPDFTYGYEKAAKEMFKREIHFVIVEGGSDYPPSGKFTQEGQLRLSRKKRYTVEVYNP
jgi:hypothetical protein